jgi:hypothetical protein
MNTNLSLTTKDGKPVEVSEEGSLGLLALGYIGLILWREKRQQIRAQSVPPVENKPTDSPF